MTSTNATLGRLARPRTTPAFRDAALALVAFALTLLLLAQNGGTRSLDPLGVVLASVASFPLLAHRRAPLAVFALTTAASASLNALGYTAGPPFGPTFALFFIAADERTRQRIRQTTAVVVALFAVHVLSAASTEGGFPASPVLFGILVWGSAWVIGDQVRQRRQRVARTEQDTARERRLAVAEERNRIARDLHDSAAHSINVILVQAGAARLLQERDPAAARVALTTIEDVARETIGEIDQMIRGLREDGTPRPNEAIEPPTGLAALDTLAERHRAAGLPVAIQFRGQQRSLAPGLDQAAFRIVQESLTNAARHGNGDARVEVAYDETALELTISNPVAAGPETIEVGHGILGMHERAALLGGSLAASFGNGRFRVHARVPYAGGAQDG